MHVETQAFNTVRLTAEQVAELSRVPAIATAIERQALTRTEAEGKIWYLPVDVWAAVRKAMRLKSITTPGRMARITEALATNTPCGSPECEALRKRAEEWAVAQGFESLENCPDCRQAALIQHLDSHIVE